MKFKKILNYLKLKFSINNSFNLKNISSLDNIKKNSIIFYEGNNLESINKKIKNKKNIILILNKKLYTKYKYNKILSTNPRITFYKIVDYLFLKKFLIQRFKTNNKFYSKNIDPSSKIGNNVSIGKNVKIGKNCSIDNCKLGNNTIISDNCVIGNSGFGFIKYRKKLIHNPHYGNVIIGNNSYVGPLTNIERGHIDDTIIGDDVKIDSLVQIGHNCSINRFSIITAGSILCGNVKIGKNVFIGVNTCIKERQIVRDNVIIGAGSNVINSLHLNQTYFGNPAKVYIK